MTQLQDLRVGPEQNTQRRQALAIEARGLRKAFGETVAVDGIDLSVPAGTVYGVLGPNGAGKTTTIRMLATLLHPTAGTATVLGHDVVTDASAVRRRVSLTGQFASVDEELSGRENPVLLGRILGLRKAEARDRAGVLLDAFGLDEAGDRLARDYSGGMRRRLDIAAGSPREYLQQLLPGVLVMTVSWITMYTGQALNTDISKGVLDRFRSLPIWRPAVLVGMLLADTARYLMASVVILTVGIVLGFRPHGGPVGVLLAVSLLLVFAFSMSWVWTAIGMRLPTPESVMQMSMTVLFPLTFASNVFVDPKTMPGWVQAFVNVNPISHLASAARGLMHGTGAGADVGWVLLWSAALLALFAPLTMRIYNSER